MWKLHGGMETHSHQMTNLRIEVAGERAVSETYVTVVLRSAGRWAIDHRIYLNDWMTFVPVPAEPTSPITGRRDGEDASYAAFAELRSRERT
jgi:hypothetical protein